MGLSEHQRVSVRHHLGYPNVEPSTSIQLGMPAAGQAAFLVERAMDNVIEEALPIIAKCIGELDSIDEEISQSRRRLKAQQIGDLKLRNNNEEPGEPDLLEKEYRRWAMRLADALGSPINPFSERHGGGGSAPSINRRVITGV